MKKQKGITLIALVITIIVMLILVGVSVSVALNTGLFITAKESTTQMDIAQEKEQLLMATMGVLGEDGKVDFSKLDNNLPDNFTKIADKTYESSTGNKYQVEENGNIILGNNSETTIACGIEGHYVGDGKGEHGIAITDCLSGHTYTCECSNWTVHENGTYTMKTAINGKIIYNTGENLPCGYISVDNDIYTYGNYKYTYLTVSNGWKVEINTDVTDKNQTSYGTILESINGQPVTNMSYTFRECTSLTTAPEIPNSVTNMYMTFYGCTALTTATVIPNSVTNMYRTFQGCTNLTTAPEIPNSVTNMEGTFMNCTALTTAPDMSKATSVTDMSSTFKNCTNLTTAPVIPNSVTSMHSTFSGCTALTTAPDMSKATSVTDMSYAFERCTALTTAPEIPNSVTIMYSTFSGCTALTGTITINANIKNYSTSSAYYSYCFNGTTQPIVLVGSNTAMLEKIATTSTNGNVTVGE